MKIEVLDQSTIDKIAAGEVIERPASIVKELVENSIDAGASSVTVEIKEGGISLIRITDNGSGIPKKEVPFAFLRHATSKIRKVEDLLDIHSLGFRGEALSSIAAVCQVEMLTKTQQSLTGIRYQIEGGEEKGMEEVGIPEGTTFLVRNIFYNTPARKKFLKSAVTEAGYVSDLIEKMALSHPEVSFKFISNNQIKLHTSGNSNLKDIVYHLFGREIANQVLPIFRQQDGIQLEGLVGKPVICRGNRNYESCFINGRYMKSKILMKAIEDAYKPFLMQHKYPFVVLHLRLDGSLLDINVHPAKMEVRFWDNDKIYRMVEGTLRDALEQKELIPEVSLFENRQQKQEKKIQTRGEIPEPFEKKRIEQIREQTPPYLSEQAQRRKEEPRLQNTEQNRSDEGAFLRREPSYFQTEKQKATQMTLFSEKLLDEKSVSSHQVIGQIFDTYWLVQYQDKLYIIDQHAAHEKVLYERTMKGLKEHSFTSQIITPPVVVSLSMQEEALFLQYRTSFEAIGFEIESFGGREYSIRAIPGNLFGIEKDGLFLELLDSLGELSAQENPDILNEKIASMSCKAAVKGNHHMTKQEAQALIEELLTLENPYHCPHGRPTIISMTKYELEKKFKRIL
ncbi:MAG: DNA mismatch repair endonuclease MutL [Lachnospiraceae bacterium]|nr:DNA mismatch repair endonuclease MutL [Robinsoniella sp.]MDY3765403.1 DNA mismatch repair endonuclease MutL [Lachnospiraceae bacterium]